MAAWCDDMRWSDDDVEARDDRLEARAHIDFDGCTDYDWDGTLDEEGAIDRRTAQADLFGVVAPSSSSASVAADGFHTTPVVGLEPSGETTAYTSAASVLLRDVERVIANLEEAA